MLSDWNAKWRPIRILCRNVRSFSGSSRRATSVRSGSRPVRDTTMTPRRSGQAIMAAFLSLGFRCGSVNGSRPRTACRKSEPTHQRLIEQLQSASLGCPANQGQTFICAHRLGGFTDRAVAAKQPSVHLRVGVDAVFVDRRLTQLSTRKPSTRPNSRLLLVTRVKSRLSACAAIKRS